MIFSGSLDAIPSKVSRSMFSDRRCQFVDRAKWDLSVTAHGLEIDEYDDGLSEYLIVHDGQRHLGSCRVRSFEQNTMLLDHFAETFPGAETLLEFQRHRLCELTRFCRKPQLSPIMSKVVLTELFHLMDSYMFRKQFTGFVAVVFPKVARFMDRTGMKYTKLKKSTLDGDDVLLVCITKAQSRSVGSKSDKLVERTPWYVGDASTQPFESRIRRQGCAEHGGSGLGVNFGHGCHFVQTSV